MDLPDYYSRLGPFRDVFRNGTPILTYHHVGPRRSGARLKGLYVSPGLFSKQLSELKREGYESREFGSVVARPTGGDRRVYLTFDDGFLDLHEHALPLLREVAFRGIVFLVAGLIGKTNTWQQAQGDIVEPLMNEPHIKDWLGAGNEIGSHTMSHPRLSQLPLSEAREEIMASKKKLEDVFSRPVDHFCYPYGDWNPRVRDLVGEAGYKTACTTEAGVNAPETSAYELKRFTARYRSRSLKSLWSEVRTRIKRGKSTS
jgi:peptidoglycan/xylan/chitin deacetylase (PgdA/CDA1 family)